MAEHESSYETYQAQPQNHTSPKDDVIGRLSVAHKARLLQDHEGQLQHLAHEAVAAQLLGDAGHDDLVANGADQEGDDGGKAAADLGLGGGVNVPAQERVDGHVPLPRELHPVGAVPPVGVEVAVGKVGDLGKGAQNVLEDDEEDEEKGQHEGEQQPGDGLGKDEQGLGGRRDRVEAPAGLLQHGQDELLRDDGQQEDAAKGGDDLGNERGPVNGRGARVLELVAQRRAEQVVSVVGPGEVARVRDVANGAGELARQVFAQLADALAVRVAVGVAVSLAVVRQRAPGVLDARVLVSRCLGGGGRVVQVAQPLLRLREVSIVKGVRVHLHEQHHGVKDQEHLGGPCPLEQKGDSDPERQPYDLVDTLDSHATFVPCHAALASPEDLVQRQAHSCTRDHEEVGNGQMPQLVRKEAPNLQSQRASSILDIAQACRNGHDGQADPEEVEEAMEIFVIRVWVKMRQSRGEIDRGKESPPLFGPYLLACTRQGFGRLRRILRDGC